MAISDAQFRLGVVGAGIALALAVGSFRFCGSVSLPPKQTTAAPVAGNAKQLMNKTSGTQSVYVDMLAKDAATAGVRVPSLDDMRRELAATSDTTRRVLEVGAPAIKVGGLEIAAKRAGDAIGLEIYNTTGKDLAYLVATTPTPASTACNSARPLPFNAMVIGKGQRELRIECGFVPGMVIALTRVETVELAPLSAFYLSIVPPELVGIEDRIARGHRGPSIKEKCSPLMGEALRSGIESGEIRWRDLVDFYARHRCQTFQFPVGYRAFTADDPRPLPVTQ